MLKLCKALIPQNSHFPYFPPGHSTCKLSQLLCFAMESNGFSFIFQCFHSLSCLTEFSVSQNKEKPLELVLLKICQAETKSISWEQRLLHSFRNQISTLGMELPSSMQCKQHICVVLRRMELGSVKMP